MAGRSSPDESTSLQGQTEHPAQASIWRRRLTGEANTEQEQQDINLSQIMSFQEVMDMLRYTSGG
jgi:hypothetical protein